MKQFELELNTKLFIRTPQGIEFTPSGEEAIKLATRVLYEIDNFKTTFQTNSPHSEGTITIVATKIQSAYFLNKAIVKFSKIHPNIKLNYIEADLLQALRILEDHKATIGILPRMESGEFSTTPAPFKNSAEWISLNNDRVTIIVNKTLNLSRKKSVSYSTLDKYPLTIHARNILEDSFWYQVINHYVDNNPLPVFVATNGFLFFNKIIEENFVGIGSLHASAFSDTLENNENIRSQVAFIPVRDGALFDNCLVVPKHEKLEPFVECFKEFIRCYCQENLTM
jgi:Transcriptional regulator